MFEDVIVALVVVMLLIASTIGINIAEAEVVDVAVANTYVYVRDNSGEVVGCIGTGDIVKANGSKDGWVIVEIEGNTYRIWHEYVDIKSVDDNEVKYSKIKKSKSNGNPTIKNKKEYSIEGSVFEDVFFW